NQPRELPDFIGINFSPVSKRVADAQTREVLKNSTNSKAVAVFYQNTESEILEILEKYSFKTIQLYAGDVSPAFVRSLKVRVLLAVKVSDQLSWNEIFTTQIEPYAADVDCFILDGAKPGSGERILADFPTEFPYPFFLAGGLHEENLETVLAYQNCIGVDIASGIETEGLVDFGKIRRIARGLAVLPLPHDLSDRF
ncbi:MAG: phosphoribosylanthranilate isomerase, partial [Saprospiraceae bacterium]|nr:phosphoribosylanthranilate isomerase [Saprospiraceae bacterium]